uniref:collagen alpha-1(III) chain-like n=1 Tax=Jaculus jaculus TaxID=51337 RepID=UPI001E1B14A0|nr:collagen alpha-1(III) chain-like [Jaculus jaculus]
MHHHPRNRERAINLSILSVSGPDFGFPEAARRVMGITPPHRQSASFMVGTTTSGTPNERVPGESGDGKGRTADARAPRATRPPFPQRGRGDEAGGGRHEGGHPGRPHPPQAPHPSARETGPNTAGDPNDHRDADTPSHPPRSREEAGGEAGPPTRGRPPAGRRARSERPQRALGRDTHAGDAAPPSSGVGGRAPGSTQTGPEDAAAEPAGGRRRARRKAQRRDTGRPASGGQRAREGRRPSEPTRPDVAWDTRGYLTNERPLGATMVPRDPGDGAGRAETPQRRHHNRQADASTRSRGSAPHAATVADGHVPPPNVSPARQTDPNCPHGDKTTTAHASETQETLRIGGTAGTVDRQGGGGPVSGGEGDDTASRGPGDTESEGKQPWQGHLHSQPHSRAGRGRPKTVERPNRRRDPTPHHDADTRATAANRPATRRDIAATPQRPSVESRRPGFRSGKGKSQHPLWTAAGTRRPSATRAHAHKHRQPHGTGSTGGERGGASDGRIDSAQRDPPRTHEQGDEGRGRQSQRTVPTAGTGGTPHHAPGWLVRAKPRPTHVDIQGETGGYYAQTKGGGRRGIRGPPRRKTYTGAHHNSAIAAGGWRRGSGAGTTPPLSLRHLEGQPGALQEHHKGPRQRRSTHRSGGHVARHRGQPLPVRRGTANRTRGRRRNGKRDQGPAARNRGPPATVTGREVKQSRAGYRTPAFHTPPTGGEEKRGARRQNEKSGPIRHECPSLAWRGLGPARSEHHRTTSINQTSGRTTSGKGTRGDPFGSEEPKDIGRNEPGGQSHRERPRLDTDMRSSRENTTRVTREDSGRWVNRGLRFKRPQKKNLPEGKKKGKKFHHPTGALGRLQPAAATESGNQDPEEKDPR